MARMNNKNGPMFRINRGHTQSHRNFQTLHVTSFYIVSYQMFEQLLSINGVYEFILKINSNRINDGTLFKIFPFFPFGVWTILNVLIKPQTINRKKIQTWNFRTVWSFSFELIPKMNSMFFFSIHFTSMFFFSSLLEIQRPVAENSQLIRARMNFEFLSIRKKIWWNSIQWIY